MFIEIPKGVTVLTSHQPTFPCLRLLAFYLPSSHSLISGLLLCLPIFFFLIPSPSHIHLPSLPILWFSAWLPSRLEQDGLSPEPPHIQHQCLLLKMPTNVTFYLFHLLVYLSYAYITASPQEHWKVVSVETRVVNSLLHHFWPSSQLKCVIFYVLKCLLQIQKKTLRIENDY